LFPTAHANDDTVIEVTVLASEELAALSDLDDEQSKKKGQIWS